MKRCPKILLLSGWQVINIGDIGHTPGTVRWLKEALPEAKISVCLSQTNPTVSGMLSRRFPDVALVSGRFGEDLLPQGSALASAFEEADLVIQNSGMIYNQFWQSAPHWMEACRLAAKPFGIFGQSFDGFAPSQIGQFRELLGAAAFVYCRDQSSLIYLRQLGVGGECLDFGPDGCFGIDVRDDRRAQTWMRGKDLKEEDFLAVILRTNTPKLGLASGDPLNPLRPSPAEVLEDEARAGRLRWLIEEWIRLTGRRVALIPEVDKEIGSAQRLIYEKLPELVRKKVVVRETFWNVDEAASVLARAAAVVSMEPHSCIIALANGVPAIHWYVARHGVKAGMFADIGLPEWLHEIDKTEPGTVLAELMKIETDPVRSRNKVQCAMTFVSQRVHMMTNRIRDVVDLSRRVPGPIPFREPSTPAVASF